MANGVAIRLQLCQPEVVNAQVLEFSNRSIGYSRTGQCAPNWYDTNPDIEAMVDHKDPATMIVHQEVEWRERPERMECPGGQPMRALITRWSGNISEPTEYKAGGSDHSHVLTVVSKPVKVDLRIGARLASSRRWLRGQYLLNGPRDDTWTGLFHEDYDSFRLFVSQDLLAECYEAAFGKTPSSQITLFEVADVEDPMLQSIAQALKGLAKNEIVGGVPFVEAMGLSLASRMLAISHRQPDRSPAQIRRLADWRLRRVTEYVDANLTNSIQLAELSSLVGLSRPYFSAQFRATMGMPPHSYILHRKILRAQELLLNPGHAVVDVAVLLGFSSQAHFTTTFKRIVGISPEAWRKQQNQ
ncbi:helix-turn-helix domain-containing protein [Bradyrhizobium diazoefficiens]